MIDNRNMSEDYWNLRYRKNIYEWGLEPSPVGRLALDVAKEHGHKKVLDIGCGYGRDTLYLARNGMEAMGIDTSEEGIRLAIELADKWEADAHFIHADVLSYPFEPESYDMVIMAHAHHLLLAEDRIKLLQNIQNVLKKGGRVIDMVHSRSDQKYGEGEELEEGTWQLQGKSMHFFSREEMLEAYREFKIDYLEEWRIEEEHGSSGIHSHQNWMLVARKG
jgi:SAM-dependent methyltransferase